MYHGTIRGRPNLDANAEAEKLHKAMDGAGKFDNNGFPYGDLYRLVPTLV